MVMATYSGNLIAYLTVTKTELPFDSLEEMVEADNFKFGVMGGTVTEHLLSVSILIVDYFYSVTILIVHKIKQ